MKKKLFLTLVLALTTLMFAFMLTACVSEPPPHTHTFDMQVVTADYLSTNATCTKKAVYYYSCECGEKGTETFESGEIDVSAHSYGAWTSNGNGTHTKICTNDNSHVLTESCNYVDGVCTVCLEKPVSQGLVYSLINNDIEYQVAGLGSCTDTDIVIPKIYNDKKVTSIGYGAFSYCESLTSIEIPESVTSIGDNAFAFCNSLTKVNYLGTVDQWVQIEFMGPFSNPIAAGFQCGNAVDLCINNELVTEVVLTTATKISDLAFAACTSLTSIEIPDSVTSIGFGAFEGCGSLQYNVKDGLKYLGNESNKYVYLAGVESSSITSANIDKGCKFIGSNAFYYCSLLTSIEIPNSVTSIGYNAFYRCSLLTSIEIPNSVTSIGEEAFIGCYSLTSIEIPESVTSIGYNAFGACYSLNTVTFDGTIDQWVQIGFAGSESDLIGPGYNLYINNEIVTEVVLTTTTKISDYAFFNCDSLTSIEISDSVTSMGDSAFSNCSSLTSIEIPNSVTSIGDSAFSNCSSLTSIEIPSSVTIIGESAFKGCTSLTSIEISDSVTSIGDFAFSNCSSLTSIEIPSSVTIIGESAFKGCTSLTSIEISDSVTSIGDSAFSNCSSLTSIEIPNSVTSIGEDTFFDCDSLTSIEIPNSVTSIGGYAFYGCRSLTSVNYLGTVDQWVQIEFVSGLSNPIAAGFIYGNAVDLCINNELVTEVVLTTATRIAEYAFAACSSLTNIVIPDGVTSIGYYAFDYCSSLTNIEVNSGNTIYKSIDGNLYSKDGKTLIKYATGKTATAFTIPNSVTSIGEDTFFDCDSLTSIEIPESVTSIGYNAFYGCGSLSTITFDGTVEQWNAIFKGFGWESSVPATYVQCLDGIVNI